MSDKESTNNDAEPTGAGCPRAAQPFRCEYCGGSLDLRYHFCVHCGREHREPDPKLYADPAPFVPSLETRIQTEGRPAVTFFLFLVAGPVIIGSLRDLLPGEEWAIVAQSLLVVVFTTAFAIIDRRQIAYLFRTPRPSGMWWWSWPLLVVFLVLNKIYHQQVTEWFDIEGVDFVAQLRESFPLPVLLLLVCVLPGVFEEIGFRGFVQERMVAIAGLRLGILITSCLFVVLHFSLVSAPYLFLLSYFFCWVRHKTRSIYLTILLHFAHNLAVMFYF